MYLEFNSPDLKVAMKEYNTIDYHINDIQFDVIDFNLDKSLLESNNYIEENLNRKYIPLGLNKTNNIFSITMKDQFIDYSISMFPNLRLALMRQLNSHTQYSPSFNTDNTKLTINDHLYLHASENFNLINKQINIPYFHSQKFFHIRN